MKTISVAVVISVLGLALMGCGPSAEQQKMIADLTSEVTTMVNSASSSLENLDQVAGQITSAVSSADSLKMKFPKDSTSIGDAITQLKSAKDRLVSVRDNVSAWVKNYKTPDATKLKFDQVVSELKKNKEEVTTAVGEVQGAIGAATAVLDGYKSVASGLMSKVAAKKGK